MLRKIRDVWNSKFGKDVIITILGQMIVLLCTFGVNKLLSINLGTIGYGEYSIIKRTAGVITYIILAGMGIAIPKYIATYRQLEDDVKEARYLISGMAIMFLLSGVTLFLLFIIKSKFAKVLFSDEGYEFYIFPMLFYSLSLALTTFVYSYYRSIDKFYKYSISQIFIQIVTLIIAFKFSKNLITLLYVWSFIIGGYGVYICLDIWNIYYKKAKIKSINKDLKPYIHELITFCFPRIPGEFVLFAYTVVPLIIINYKDGIEVSAYFAAATSINSMVSPLFSFVGLVLLPMISKSVVSNDFSEADNKIKGLAKIYLIIGVLGIIFVEVFTPFIINMLFSSEYMNIIPVVRIMILAVLPNAFYLLLRNPLDAISKIPYNTINLSISFLALNIMIFMSSDIISYSLSFVISYVILGVLSFRSWKKCKKELSKGKVKLIK